MYPHHELVLQWLAGAKVEYLQDGEWRTLPAPGEATKMPHFYVDRQYRLQSRTLRFRVATTERGVQVVRTMLQEENLARSPGFRGWLTGWEEVPL